MNPKKHSSQSLIGQKGVNLIERIVLEMGHVWNPTTLDAGIDGTIELRNSETSEATNLIVQVQSKATETILMQNENENLEYVCDERDLDYWMKGNTPVILVRSDLQNEKAYWVSIKDYFKDPARLKSKKIVFNRTKDAFSIASKEQLFQIAKPAQSGLYFSPPTRQEALYSNILQLEKVPEFIFVANTRYRKAKQFWNKLNELEDKRGINKSWFLHDKKIYSFNNLNESPWNKFIGKSKVTSFKTTDWSHSHDINLKRNFIALLNAAFDTFAFHKGLLHCRFDPVDLYYFRPILNDKGLPKKVKKYYDRRGRKSFQTVCNAYARKSDPKIISYYRHLALEIAWHRFNMCWYLQITPTYFFTHDGFKLHYYYESKLKGKKALDTAETVFSETLFWSDVLNAKGDMFDKSIIGFNPVLSFELNHGINDTDWIKAEDKESVDVINNGPNLFENDTEFYT